MKATIQTVKGTREFYPEDMAGRSWLYSQIRQVSEQFGYQEYDGPFLEKIDLYAAKSGEELVKEQSFVFPDRGGDLITLRPELTPSLARMVAARQNELTLPLRWWSFGPFWRYERPQKGRTREFFQWNIDLIGPVSPEADAEMVAICAAFFRQVGLTPAQVGIAVNDRRLMEAQVNALGVAPENRASVFRLIDRRDKMRPAEWETYGLESGLTVEQVGKIQALLGDKELWRQSPELARFFTALEALGVSEYVRYDAGVIRGLDYYTGTVFEAQWLEEGGRAILGGGRYDNLVGDVGGAQVGGVGFAMGDVMISIVLRANGLLPEKSQSPAPVLVTVFDEPRLPGALRAAAELREAGVKVVCFTEPVKLPRQLKWADKMGIRLVVLSGPDEEAAGQVTVKDLSTREQVSVARSELAETVKKMLAVPAGS